MSDFDKFIDKLLTGMFWLLLAFVVVLLMYLIPRDIDRTNRAEELAKQMGCDLIGSARDLGSVKFFDCNGDVVMKRVK